MTLGTAVPDDPANTGQGFGWRRRRRRMVNGHAEVIVLSVGAVQMLVSEECMAW